MQHIINFMAKLGFWPYVFLFTLLAVIISELLILVQSHFLTGTFFDTNLLIAGFITPAIDGFIVFLLTAFLIRHLVAVQKSLKAAEKQLRHSNRRLEEAQEIAHLGFWEMDLQSNRLFWSDAVYRIFGLEPGEFEATYEVFLEHVHPGDRDALVREYQGSIDGHRPYNLVHRIVRKDGAIRYVEERCRHTYDDAGAAVKSIGTVYDITERVADQYKLQRLFDLQKNIVIQTDGTTLKKANQSLLQFFGFDTVEEFQARHRCICELFVRHEKFFHLGKVPEGENWIETINSFPKIERVVSMVDANLHAHAFSVSVNHFDDNDFIVAFTDISETILEQFSLEQRVSRDHLTGAYTRDFFDTHIVKLIENAEKHNRFLGLIMFDIDHFKKVNDTFGHNIGDKVLKHLVITVKYSIRDEDLLFRWGGEEFLLVAEAESPEKLKRMAEHIRQRVENEPFPPAEQLTCSFGMTLHDPANPIQRSIQEADAALYQAKEHGRNRVCVAAECPETAPEAPAQA